MNCFTPAHSGDDTWLLLLFTYSVSGLSIQSIAILPEGYNCITTVPHP